MFSGISKKASCNNFEVKTWLIMAMDYDLIMIMIIFHAWRSEVALVPSILFLFTSIRGKLSASSKDCSENT